MSSKITIVECLIKGTISALGSVIPGAAVPADIIVNAWNEWDKAKKMSEKLAELEAYARTEFQQHLAEIRAELIATNFPQEARATVEAWLGQMPGLISRAWNAPRPSQTTVPDGTRLNQPSDLQVYLSPVWPRFTTGSTPIPGFTLIRPLGVGGYSEVWLAKHENLQREVALKFPLARPVTDGAPARNPLEHERDIQVKLYEAKVRDGILVPLDYRKDNGIECLVYDYVAGGDLTSYIRQLHRLNLPKSELFQRAINVIRLLSQIVAQAHAAGVTHRDLKPANILVDDATPGRERFRVADFGIGALSAQYFLQHGPTGSSTAHTAYLGSCTWDYASPEQKRNSPPSSKDDVHALGVIWYQLLTGRIDHGMHGGWRREIREMGVPEEFITALEDCVLPADKRLADAAALIRAIDVAVLANDEGEKSRIASAKKSELDAENKVKQEAINTLQEKWLELYRYAHRDAWDGYTARWNIVFALSFFMLIPTLILYGLGQELLPMLSWLSIIPLLLCALGIYYSCSRYSVKHEVDRMAYEINLHYGQIECDYLLSYSDYHKYMQFPGKRDFTQTNRGKKDFTQTNRQDD
jgi:serine/threonine protein kinase